VRRASEPEPEVNSSISLRLRLLANGRVVVCFKIIEHLYTPKNLSSYITRIRHNYKVD
jgi:hypothetical protein